MNYPLWLEIFLAICMGCALAGLGAWMLYTAAIKLIRAATTLETKRTNKETEALDSWKSAYEAEHEDHLNDVADLISKIQDERYLNAENMKEADKQIKDLLRQLKEKDALLAKVKVAEL